MENVYFIFIKNQRNQRNQRKIMQQNQTQTQNIVILISGRGSNMEAIVKSWQHQMFPQNTKIAAVISNNADATGLNFAKQHNIATEVLSHKNFASRQEYDQSLIKIIDKYTPKLVVLAGFMRILSPEFVQHYQQRLMNIHPSLLPSLTGLHTHKRAIESGLKIHGCTVHFVTAELDAGPIIIQGAVPVLPNDNEDILAARVLKIEHKIYSKAIQLFLQGKINANSDSNNQNADEFLIAF